jgi:hypothetical protein
MQLLLLLLPRDVTTRTEELAWFDLALHAPWRLVQVLVPLSPGVFKGPAGASSS